MYIFVCTPPYLKLNQLIRYLVEDGLVPELHLGKNLLSKHHKSTYGIAWEL